MKSDKQKRFKPRFTIVAGVFTVLMVLIPALSVSGLFVHNLSGQLHRSAEETVSVSLDRLCENTDDTMRAVQDCLYYLISDPDSKQLMRRSTMPTRMERARLEAGLNRAVYLGGQLDPAIVTGIFAIRSEEDYFAVQGGVYRNDTIGRVLEIYRSCLDRNAAGRLYADTRFPGYAYLISDYIDTENQQVLGKVVVEMNIRSLINVDSIRSLYPSALAVVQAADGSWIDTDTADNAQTAELLSASSDSSKWYAARRTPLRGHIRIEIRIQRSEILNGIYGSIISGMTLTLGIILLSLLIGIPMVLRLLRPINHMLPEIDRIADGDLTVHLDDTPYVETDHLVHAFNEMTVHLDTLFYENYQKGLLLRSAEIDQLEAQIHPHFIFNVLELINMRCMAEGAYNVCPTVGNLAQMLRFTVRNKKQQMIRLGQEMDYVKCYLALQKERFGDKLTYVIDIEDDDLLDCLLPKLVIQPLVENAVVHGLEPQRGGGVVRIIVWEEEDAFCVRVSDNGVGFRSDDPPKPDDGKHNHVALENIRRRLTLLYNGNAEMTIQSAAGEGTNVTLNIPLRYTKKENDHAEGADCGQ